MALSGIQIYKLLPGGQRPPHPKANCKECGFPTCLAFAMKLAAKQAELASCQYVSDEAKEQLSAAAAPPIRLVTVRSNGHEMSVGNETVMYRHEKTFFNKPGIFVRVKDTDGVDAIKAAVEPADAYSVNYVGIDLSLDGFAVEAVSGDAATFKAAVQAVRSISKRPLILIGDNPGVIKAGLEAAEGSTPLIYKATPENWEEMVKLAKEAKAPLAVCGNSLDELADLTQKANKAGIEDLVLDPCSGNLKDALSTLTALRRLALKQTFRPLGYPIITFPGAWSGDQEVAAMQAISKYGGFIVLEEFSPASLYPLLVFRQNIYTDPQKPIQVTPGLYEINKPTADDPVLVTTNFSITYFSVSNEIEGSGNKGWLLVADAEGMSVLTAWAAGKFDAERIAKTVKSTGVEDKINHRRIIIPGHVAVLSGELEEELPDWEIKVGPREAVNIPQYLKLVNA
ncbi:MAG: acetyl-CoA decarbonylase/synthase complex subunit gamma [Anaerolineales bacterium]|nr:acetyl-CoA decarbonylase/synthase complex subunit gamma [Anaerolineales bacterium]